MHKSNVDLLSVLWVRKFVHCIYLYGEDFEIETRKMTQCVRVLLKHYKQLDLILHI